MDFKRLTLRITGRKKQSEERAALFAVRVHAIVSTDFMSQSSTQAPSNLMSNLMVQTLQLFDHTH